MAGLEALIFDVDGTLADTERDGHRVAFNAAFSEAGLDWVWSPELYGELLRVTGGKERIRYYLQHHRPDFVPEGDPDAFIADLHARKTVRFTAMVERGDLALRPGVRRLLQEARDAGTRLAIATTTTPANVEALLIHALDPDSPDWFEVIAAGDIVPAKKPAPDIYHYALRLLDLPATDCLAVEDSANGLRSAAGAGIPTVVTVSTYTRDEDFSGAALIADGLGEPDAPATILGGSSVTVDNGARACIDLDLLQRIHGGRVRL